MSNILSAIQSLVAPVSFRPAPSVFLGGSKMWKYQGGNTGGGGTFCTLATSEASFTAGSLVLANPSASFIRIGAVCVAASAVENDGFSPLDGSGAAVTWTVVPGGPWVIPPGKYLAPNFNGPYRPGILKIPFTLASIARSDTASYPPILMARVYALDPIYSGSGTASQVSAQRAAYGPGKRTWNGFFKAGNFVASNQAGLASPTAGYHPILGVEFATNTSAKSFVDIGDSTTQGAKSMISVSGTATLHDYNGPLAQWQDTVSSLTRPVYCANLGYQGWTVEQFMNAADEWLSNGWKPTGVIIQPWSSNSPNLGSQGAMDADYLRARNFALKCRRSGMVAILKTPKPAALAVASDAIRKAIVARVKADIFPYVDSDAAVSDGGTPAKLQTVYDSGDGVHCNNAGYGQEATAAYAPVLGNYI